MKNGFYCTKPCKRIYQQYKICVKISYEFINYLLQGQLTLLALEELLRRLLQKLVARRQKRQFIYWLSSLLYRLMLAFGKFVKLGRAQIGVFGVGSSCSINIIFINLTYLSQVKRRYEIFGQSSKSTELWDCERNWKI